MNETAGSDADGNQPARPFVSSIMDLAPTSHRSLVAHLLLFALLTGACGTGSGGTGTGYPGDDQEMDGTQAPVDVDPTDEGPAPTDEATIMAAAIGRLIAEDHTFGDGPPPFTLYLLLTGTDPDAGSAGRPLSAGERAAIETVVAGFGPVQWIEDAAEHRSDDLGPEPEGAVIIGTGEPVFEAADSALVPVSLWCGGLCGTWVTYRVGLVDGTWRVTGTEGPIAVS